MLSLPELSQTYKNSHPHYIDPLAYFDATDHELADLKREALFPYLENLEEKMVIYRARMVAPSAHPGSANPQTDEPVAVSIHPIVVRDQTLQIKYPALIA